MPRSSLQSVPPHRIKLLDNRLANQIAAGEVVERPASVVKELLENAIDSGASRIELDVERGGTRLIRIIDNGCGIVKQDLALALARHATSKISKSSDLACIHTLGFRGEALASISSVSKLTLTSRTNDSDFAWQAIAEGRNMDVEILPAASTVGTRIEVRDLFYNTPARQKFLKAERTEFNHIEEIFKRHALANRSIAFILKNNNKVVKRVPATQDISDLNRRIESICGLPFSRNAHYFSCDHELLQLEGWLGGVDFHRSDVDIQYVFLNGRPVKDKMLNHAIRQAYSGLLPAGRMPTFVIFLSINTDKIDVNVHPTKHEVRFDDQRMVHDLLVKSISEQIDSTNGGHSEGEPRVNSPLLDEQDIVSQPRTYSYSDPSAFRGNQFGVGYSKVNYLPESAVDVRGEANKSPDTRETQDCDFSKIRLNQLYWIIMVEGKAYLVNEQKLLRHHLSLLITSAESNTHGPSTALLFPQTIKMDTRLLEQFATNRQLEKLGFVYEPLADKSISLQKIPNWLIDLENSVIVNNFENWARLAADPDCSLIDQFHSSIKPSSDRLIERLIDISWSSLSEDYARLITVKDLQSMIDEDE